MHHLRSPILPFDSDKEDQKRREIQQERENANILSTRILIEVHRGTQCLSAASAGFRACSAATSHRQQGPNEVHCAAYGCDFLVGVHCLRPQLFPPHCQRRKSTATKWSRPIDGCLRST